MAKYRVLMEMYDNSTGRLLSPGEEVELDLSEKDRESAIKFGVIEPVQNKLAPKK